MGNILPLETIEKDIQIHATFLSQQLSKEQTLPPTGPSPSDPPQIDYQNILHLNSIKEIIVKSLLSFFPQNLRYKSVKSPIICPFWQGAMKSIQSIHPPTSPMITTKKIQINAKNSKNNIEKSLDGCTWNILQLAVRSNRIDVLKYLLNLPQNSNDSDKIFDNKYDSDKNKDNKNSIKSEIPLQFLKGRRVPVDKPLLLLSACYYDNALALHLIRDFIFLSDKRGRE
jgi:hypothetical protein